MEYTKDFFEKVFSVDRMKKYFFLYPEDEQKTQGKAPVVNWVVTPLYLFHNIIYFFLQLKYKRISLYLKKLAHVPKILNNEEEYSFLLTQINIAHPLVR